jgi:hypothetical protein
MKDFDCGSERLLFHPRRAATAELPAGLPGPLDARESMPERSDT